MKRVGKPVFFIVAFLILFVTYTSIFGIHGRNGDIPITYIKGVNDIRWGIDIRGGVEATFGPTEGVDATNEQIDAAKTMIENRMVTSNITDYEIYADNTNDRIIVRFPWRVDESEFDPETAIEELSATANLTFREGMEYETSEVDVNGDVVYRTPAGVTAENVLLEGSDVASAQAVTYQDPTTGQLSYQISLEFTEEGAAKFAEATERLLNETISIWMDDVMISYPTVESVITDGHASITGSFTAQSASSLASRINAGAMPIELETKYYGTIDPTLGESALMAMALAGVLALVIVSLGMILIYRLPGFIACIALLGQVGLSLAAVSGYFGFVSSFTLTLPGIAGIILSIGMGVDANVITSERIKEEVRSGKTLDGAIDKGCKNSFWAIFDGNITNIIVSLVLMGVFGPTNIFSMLFGPSTTGVIYSFGYTLLVGTIANFIMGMTASRLMTKSLSGFKFARNKWLYGGKGK